MSARALGGASVLALAAVSVFVVVPRWRATVVAAAGLVALAAIVVRGARYLGAAGARAVSPFDEARSGTRPGTLRPPDLEALERALSWGAYSARDYEHRVRPLLRPLVAHRLRERHGVDLERDPARARALLPASLQTLVNGTPAGRVTTADIAALLDDIDAL